MSFNPILQRIYLMYTLIRQLKKIELYNISGKLLLVKSINYEKQIKLNTSEFVGLLSLRVYLKDGRVLTRKLVSY